MKILILILLIMVVAVVYDIINAPIEEEENGEIK